MSPFLNERGRRLFAANEAISLGRGGVTAVAVATGIARSTINRGVAELKAAHNEIGRGIRRPGAGRKREAERQPGLLTALDALIEDAIRGDPEAPLRWVSRSQRNIAEALRRQDFQVSQKLIGQLLREQQYSCQANRKTREGSHHPDRNAQFEHINSVGTSRTAAASCGAREIPSRCASMTSRSRAWVRWRRTASMTLPPTRDGSMWGSMPIPPNLRSRAFAAGGNGWAAD